MRLKSLQAALGLSEPRNFDKCRDRIGKRKWEHVEDKGEYRGVWVYTPGWLADWRELDRSPAVNATAAGSLDEDKRKRAERRDRIEEIELRSKELDLGERESRLVDVDAFLRDRLGPCLDEIRKGIETANRWPEAQRLLVDSVNAGIERLQANGSVQHLTGDRSAVTRGSSTVAAAAPANPSRVRRKVRQARNRAV